MCTNMGLYIMNIIVLYCIPCIVLWYELKIEQYLKHYNKKKIRFYKS